MLEKFVINLRDAFENTIIPSQAMPSFLMNVAFTNAAATTMSKP